MIESIVLMCAIVGLSPVEVDCNTQWLIIQDTDMFAPYTNEFGNTSHWKGSTIYNYEKNPVTDTYPELHESFRHFRWSNVANLKQDNCWNDVMTEKPVNCIPLIWHELKHQMCTCDWHEDLVPTFKSFSNVDIFGGL